MVWYYSPISVEPKIGHRRIRMAAICIGTSEGDFPDRPHYPSLSDAFYSPASRLILQC